MRIGDFQIESDVLKKYDGTAETVIIPEERDNYRGISIQS